VKFKSDENPEDRGKRLHSVVTAYLKGQESDIPASLKGIILDNVVKGFIHVYPSYRGVYGIYDKKCKEFNHSSQLMLPNIISSLFNDYSSSLVNPSNNSPL